MNKPLRGYIGDEPFILNYEDEQSPTTIAYRAAASGADAPDPAKPFTYCDIGCGRAVTITVLAAANPQSQFIGIDPNPEHIAEARERAGAAGLSNIRFIENYIGKLGEGDLPKLDFATANGLYSCIDPEEQGRLRRQVARFLAPGGLFQVSYNMAAGCAQMEPLRRVMKRIADEGEGDPAERREKAVRTIQRLAQEGHPFFEMNPKAKLIVEDWARRDVALLAHTYFHSDWPLHDPAEIIELFDAEGLGFCGPWDLDLTPPDDRDAFATPDGGDAILRETLAATMRADTYRTDVFRLGPPMGGDESPKLDDGMLFGPATARVWLDDASKADPIATFVLSRSAVRYGDIRTHFVTDGLDERHVAARLGRLIRGGWVKRYLTRPDSVAPDGPVRAASVLGKALGEDPRFVSNGAYLPAPAVGGGVYMPSMILLLLSVSEGPEVEWRQRASERIGAANRRAGRPAANHNALTVRLEDGIIRFRRDWAPFLTSVGAAEPV